MQHFIKSVLMMVTLAFSAQTYADTITTTTNTNNISPAERAKIESVVHDYLLQKPEIMVEALQSLQKKQYEQAEKTVKQTQQDASKYADDLLHQANDPVSGNPKGKVTVVEFFDYQCPHCVDMAPIMDSAIKANPDLRVVYKEFPIRGPMSEVAARAALAANKQGKYNEFSHALLNAQKPLTEDIIYTTAKSVGLNVDQLKKDMNEKVIKDQIAATTKLAQNLKLFGTPALFIGKSDGTGMITYVPGQVKPEQLQDMVSKASS